MATTPPVGSPLSASPAAQSTPDPGLPSGAAAQGTPVPSPPSNPASQSNPPVQDGGPFSGSHGPIPSQPPVSNARPGGP